MRPKNSPKTAHLSTNILHINVAAEQVFDSVKANISVRGANVLIAQGIHNLKAFMSLDRKQLLNCRNCGRKTANEIMQMQAVIAEIEILQPYLHPENNQETMQMSNEALHFGDAPAEIFNAVLDRLSVRGTHILKDQGVDNLKDFMELNREQLLNCRNCGQKTADEIMRMQAEIAETEALRSNLQPENSQQAKELSSKALRFDDAPTEILDAVKGSLSVRGTNVLASQGVDNLEAFMKMDEKQLLNCRNCGRKTADEIMQMQASITEFAYRLAEQPGGIRYDQLLAAPCFSMNAQTDEADVEMGCAEKENPAQWLEMWVRSLARSRNQARAFMLRKGMLGNHPMTLDMVGKQLGITRERVRQIEKVVEKRAAAKYQQLRLRPLIDEMALEVKQRGGLVGLDDLTKAVLSKGQNGKQLEFARGLIAFFSTLQIWKDSGLLLPNNRIVTNRNSLSFICELAEVIEDVALTAADERFSDDLWSIDLKYLKAALGENAERLLDSSILENMSDILIKAAVKLRRERLRVNKDRVYSTGLWQLRFGKLVPMLNIVLYQLGKPTHFKEITREARKWRPEISDNNIHNALDRSKSALLWNRGTYIHKDYAVIDSELINEVEEWLIGALQDDVPFVSINGAFLHFRTQCKRANYPSEVALYTCLRQSQHPALTYPKLPWVYRRKDFKERIPLMLAIDDFLRDAGGVVKQEELREFGLKKLFLKDFQFTQLTQRISNVIRTADWGHLHLDNFVLDQKCLQSIIQHTQEVVSREEHCSVEKLYRDKRVTCKAAGMDSPMMLYSVLKCFTNRLFSLDRYPRVEQCHEDQKGNSSTIREHVLDFIRNSGKPCPYEVLEEHFVEQLGYKEQQVYSIARETEVCLYHPGCVIHYQSLAWNEGKQHALECVAQQIYQDAVRAGTYFGRISRLLESTGLPPLPPGLYWSHSMIADLLVKSGRYLVLGNSREAFLPQGNDHDICSFEDLIGRLLDCDWNGAANLASFEGELVKAGIIKKRLTPAMLSKGDTVVIMNGEIMLKELLVSASRP